MEQDFKECIINGKETVEDAFTIMDNGRSKYLFVIDDGGKLLGMVNQVILRASLLRGFSAQENVGKLVSVDVPFLFDTDTVDEIELQNKIAYLGKKFALKSSDLVVICNNEMKMLSVSDMSSLDKAKHSRTTKINEQKYDRNIESVCIIGGAGYLGSVLTEKLLLQGYNVRVFDNFIFGKDPVAKIKTSLINKKNVGRFEIYDGDMRNSSDVINALENIDAVILLGAVVGDPASGKYPVSTFEINYLAAQSIAEICAYLNINRLIFSSTCSVYGQSEKSEILSEDSPLCPVSHYARTKINAEKAILRVGSVNFSPTIMRMSTLYGSSYRMRYDLVVNTMMMKGVTTNKIIVFGGQQWRPLLSVSDAARAFIAVLESDISKVQRKVYNVGNEKENYQIRDLGQMIKKFLRDKGVEVEVETINQEVDLRDYKVSFSKIKSELGFITEDTVYASLDNIYNVINKQFKEDSLAEKRYYNDQNIFSSNIKGEIVVV